jgi:hypothetical protein
MPVVDNNDNDYTISFNATEYTYNPDGTYRVNDIPIKQGDKIALQECQFVGKILNVTNNTFGYTITYNGTPYVSTLPIDGYSIADFNTQLRNFQISNNLFIVNGSGVAFVYNTITTDPSTNLTNLTLLPVTNPGTPYTNPNSLTFTGTTMTITLSANLSMLLGIMPSGPLPATPASTPQTFVSTMIPKAVNFYMNLALDYPLVLKRKPLQSHSLYKKYLPINETGLPQDVEPRNLAFVEVASPSEFLKWKFVDENGNTVVLANNQGDFSFCIRPRPPIL